MHSKFARTIVIIFFGILVGGAIWLGYTIRRSSKVIGKAQVKLAEMDVEILRDALDALWSTYSLDEDEDKVYTTKSYDMLKNKITNLLIEQFGELPFGLPNGKNFTAFYYTGSDKDYHIKVRAKDRRRTLVHVTPEKVWHE